MYGYVCAVGQQTWATGTHTNALKIAVQTIEVAVCTGTQALMPREAQGSSLA